MYKLTAYLLALLLICPSYAAAQQLNVTPLKEHYLRDDVGLFDREQRGIIVSLLEKQNKKPLGRIYLDILEKLPTGESVAAYARRRLNDQPRLPGEKEDKIMLVVILKDKMVRIETSRDVWPVLSDEFCHQVNREIMIPKFKSGDYYAGIKAGLEGIIRKLAIP